MTVKARQWVSHRLGHSSVLLQLLCGQRIWYMAPHTAVTVSGISLGIASRLCVCIAACGICSSHNATLLFHIATGGVSQGLWRALRSLHIQACRPDSIDEMFPTRRSTHVAGRTGSRHGASSGSQCWACTAGTGSTPCPLRCGCCPTKSEWLVRGGWLVLPGFAARMTVWHGLQGNAREVDCEAWGMHIPLCLCFWHSSSCGHTLPPSTLELLCRLVERNAVNLWHEAVVWPNTTVPAVLKPLECF